MKSLNEYKKNITSQAGEDGIIEYLCGRFGIEKGWCVEFGAWDGKHLSNTWSLIQKGWSAVLIEGDSAKCDELKKLYAGSKTVYPICAFVGFKDTDPNRLDNILAGTPIPEQFDVLSIDIDGNDWYVWNGLKNYKPAIVIVEANSSIPAAVNKVNPADSGGGSSARALVELGRQKGYEIVAHTGNCIFVRSDLYLEVGLENNDLELIFDKRFLPGTGRSWWRRLLGMKE